LSSSSSLLVISDSHGNIAALTSALRWAYNAHIDAAIFLGDGCDDLGLASARTGFDLPWHTVRGNGDFSYSTPENMVLEVFGRKIFMSHGNRYHVREGFKTIAAAARNAGAEAALFGHTHIPYCGMVDGIFLLNPGSISRPRDSADCTFAILECADSGPLAARFFKLENRGGETTVVPY